MDLAHLGFKVDTTDLKKTEDSLVRIGTKADTTQRRLDALATTASGMYGGTNLAANEQQFRKMAESTGLAVDALGKYNTKANSAVEALRKLDTEAENIVEEFDRFAPAANDAAAGLGGISDASGRARESMGGYTRNAGDAVAANDRMHSSSGRLALGFGSIRNVIATVGVVAFFKGALSSSIEFEASMNDVEEKLGGTAEEMERLKQTALDMGISTAFSASQSADAMSSLAAKGLETSEIIGVLPDVLNLASAAQLSLEDSAKLTTATMNQFGLGVEESTRVVDLLAAVGDSSGATIQGLESALSKVGPAAAAYGVSLESTAASIAILADNGIEAEVAGTAMAGMFAKLMVATGDGADALDEIGLSSKDFIKISADGKEEFIGYADAIDTLSDAGVSATQTSRIFGLEAGKNLVPLVTAGGDAIREMEASFKDASSASEQAATQMKGMPGAVKEFSSAWEGVKLAVGDEFLRDLAIEVLGGLTRALRFVATDGIDYLAEKIQTFKSKYDEFKHNLEFSDDGIYRFLRDIGGAIESLGEFLAPVMPHIGTFAGALVTLGGSAAAISAAGTAIGVVGAAVGALSKLLGLGNPVILGIAAIGTAAYLIYDNWDSIAAWWTDMWETMSAAAVEVADWLVDAWDGIPEWFSGIWDSLKTAGSLFVSGFLSDMSGMVDGVKDLWDSFTGLSFDVELPSLSDILGGIGRFYAGVYTFWSNLAEFTFGIELPSASEIIAGMKTIIGNIVSGTTGAMLDAGKSFGNTIMSAIGLGAEEETPAAVRSIERVADVIEADTKPTFLDRAKSIGSFFGIGFADGVDETAPDAATAATNMAKGSVEAVESELQIQSPSRVMRAIGAFVSEGFAIGIESMANRAVEAAKGLSEAAVEAFDGISEGLERQLLGLQEGDEALRRYDLAQKGIIGTAAEFVLAEESKIQTLQNEARELEAAEQAQRKFVDGMVGAITQASSVKEAFGNLGSFMSGWIRDKAKEFATNKILAVLGADTSGAEASLGSFLNTAKGILSQLGGGFGDMLGGLFDKVKGFFGSGGGAGDGVLGNATSSFTSLAGSAATTAGQIAAMGVASFKIGETLGDLVGGNGKGAGIGALLGGPFGTLIGSLFGGSFETTAVGAEVGFSGGQVTGNNVELQEKQRSFWRGTERREILTELDAEISSMVGEYFDNINTTMVQAASDLGIAGADNILESFEVATERFTGETASEDLAAWLEASTLQAYQHAYTQLGPEVQTIIGGMVDIHTANAEDIAAAFDVVSVAAGTIVPELDMLGLLLSGTADEQAAYAFLLSESMGGVGETMQALDLFVREFAPAGLEAAHALEQAQASLVDWTNEVNSIVLEVPIVNSLGNIEATPEDFGAGNLGFVDESVTVTTAQYLKLFDSFRAGGVDAQLAATAMSDFVVSIDDVSGAVTLNMTGMENYFATLESGNQVQQNVAVQGEYLASVIDALGASSVAGSDGLIDTREEMYNYIQALELAKDAGEITTAQYAELHAASLQQLDDIIAVEDALREQTAIFDSFSQTAQTLGLNFDPANAGAVEMANNLVDMFGSLDAFNASTASYFDNFFSAEEQQSIALAQSAVSVAAFNDSLVAAGGSAITGDSQFRQYVEGLDLASTTGQQAFLSAMQVQEAFAEVGASGQSASDILAQTPADILGAATAFDVAATDAANDAQFMQVAVNESTSLMASTSVNSMSEMNQNVIAINSAANETNLAMTSAHQQSLALQKQESFASIKAEEIRARAEQLDLTTASGKAQYALLQQYADNTIASTGTMVDNVKGQVEFLKDGTISAFTSTKDIALGASAQLKDGVAGAFSSTKDIAIGAANDSKNSWSSAAAGISGSAGSAATALGGTAGALGTIGNAAQTAADKVADASRSFYNTTGLQASAFNDWFNDANGIDGSHAMGLDYVPFDGYIAELHKGEMVVPEESADQIRNLGPANASIGAVSSRPSLPTAPASNVAEELRGELQAMRKELEHLRADNTNLLGAIANSNGAIASGTYTQNMTLKNIEQDQDRNRRRAQVNA